MVLLAYRYKIFIKFRNRTLKKVFVIFNRFQYVILVYLLFVSFWFCAKYYRETWTPQIEGKDNWNLGSGFYVSWLASLSEDILFFGIIGFLALVISTKLPQDEEFNTRVDSITNGKKVGARAKKFLSQKIKELLVYNDKANVKIIIKSIDIEKNIIEIYSDYSNVITNMCKDVDFPLTAGAYVFPTTNNNGDYGYVSYLGIYEEGNPANAKTFYEGDIKRIDKDGIDEDTPFNISANSAAIWKFCYSIWQTINGDRKNENDWYFILTNGFTENFELTLINRTNFNFFYDIKYIDRNSQTFETKILTERIIKGTNEDGKENKETLLSDIMLYRADKIEIFFYIKK